MDKSICTCAKYGRSFYWNKDRLNNQAKDQAKELLFYEEVSDLLFIDSTLTGKPANSNGGENAPDSVVLSGEKWPLKKELEDDKETAGLRIISENPESDKQLVKNVDFDYETMEKKLLRNEKISKDPRAEIKQRERTSQKLKAMQRVVPGGCDMDIVSLLDHALIYIKLLKSEVNELETGRNNIGCSGNCSSKKNGFL